MGKAVRLVRGEYQKEIARKMESLCSRFTLWQVWQDFIIMSAIAIANAVDGPHRDSREKEYLDRAKKYSKAELDVIADMFADIVNAMEQNPDQDLLGGLFMSLDLGSNWHGQFFTPYSVCRMMASITFGDKAQEKIDEQGWVSVCDPACGAGALLIAFANECRRPGREINYQTSVLFVAQDIDYLAGCMCYIQLSLLGCPGYVVIGDTLSHPATSIDERGLIPNDGPNVWYTPMYYRGIWCIRRMFAEIKPRGEARPTVSPPNPPEPQAHISKRGKAPKPTKAVATPSKGKKTEAEQLSLF